MFNSTSSAASFPSSKVSSGTTNIGNKVQMLLPNFSASEFKFCGIVEMVGKQPGIVKWRSNSTTFATTDYSNRCIKKRIGSILPGSVSGGKMKQTVVTHAHKHSGTEGGTFGSPNFHQDVPKQVFSCLNGQHGSSHIVSKNGRYHQIL